MRIFIGDRNAYLGRDYVMGMNLCQKRKERKENGVGS